MLLDTPSKCPISVEVIALTSIAPVPLVISALAVVVANFDNAIAAVPLTSEFVIDSATLDCAIAASYLCLH